MEPQKSFLIEMSEVIDQHHAERREHQAEQPITQPGRVRRLIRWLTPNGGTLLLIALLIATQGVWARNLQSPAAPGPSATTVNYQGRLADSGGTPITGTRGMAFAIYDAATGGTLIWGPEAHMAIPVSNGLFSVGLGSQTSGGIPTTTWNGDRYLEISVGGETLSPRELIRSVPIAGMALTVPKRKRNMAQETGHHVLDNLSDYLDGEAAPEIERHLAECAGCRALIDTLRKTVSVYRELPRPEFPADARRRLYASLGLTEFLTPKN